MKRVHVFITGVVQGVFFRVYTKKKAEELEMWGWVKNLVDGRVEAVFEGPDKKIKEMISWCWEGSPMSRVKNVEVVWEKLEGLRVFEVRS